MKERPIAFSAPMVRAILEGRKSQTRRVMARQKQHHFTDYTLFGQHGHPDDEAERRGGWAEPWVAIEHAPDWPDGKEDQCRCPYAERRGDRLWVREAWKAHSTFNHLPPRDIPQSRLFYLAGPEAYSPDHARYRHARFMPRWASRILLEVTDLRIERLQAISEDDARDEGVDSAFASAEFAARYGALCGSQHRYGYATLWDAINGPGSWAANPWVWAITFRRLEPGA